MIRSKKGEKEKKRKGKRRRGERKKGEEEKGAKGEDNEKKGYIQKSKFLTYTTFSLPFLNILLDYLE